MNAQQIAILLGRLQRMASRWQDLQDIPAIERNLMLSRLSELYEEVLLGGSEEENLNESDHTPCCAPVEELVEGEELPEEEVAFTEETEEEEVVEEEEVEPVEEPADVVVEPEQPVEVVAEPVAEAAPIVDEMPWPLDADDLIAYDDNLFQMEEPNAEMVEKVEEQNEELPAENEEPIEAYLLDPFPSMVVDLSDQTVEQPAEESIPDLVPVDEHATTKSEPETAAEEIVAEPAEEEQPAEEEPIVDKQPVEEEAETPPVVEEAQPALAPQPEVIASVNLFGEEDATAVHRRKQRTILSLYEQQPQQAIKRALPKDAEVDEVVRDPEVIVISDDELIRPKRPNFQRSNTPSKAAATEPAPVMHSESVVVKPAVADEHMPQPVLGEVIKPVSTLSDQYTPPVDMATDLRRRSAVTDLRRAVDVNDKYRLIRDLFAGNGALYEITIRRLNEFDTMEDCLLYIAEHFHWNPDSDGARLLMEALERKFAR